MNNNKYHHIAATKPNVLLAKFLSNHEGDRFRLNCCFNFQTDELLKEHEKFCKNHDPIDTLIPKKFKTISNKVTNEMEQVAEKILKHLLGNKSFIDLL